MTTRTTRMRDHGASRVRTAAATVLAAMLLAGCAGGDGSAGEGPAGSAAPGPAAEPAPTPPVIPAPTPAPAPEPTPNAERFAGAAFTPDYWPLPDPGAPVVPEGLGPLTVRTETVEYRLSCIRSEITITGVDVGTDAAAEEMADRLLGAARVAHTGWRSNFASEDVCRDETGNTISAHGDTEQVILEEPCAFPDGPPLRCFLLVEAGYPAGAAHGYVSLDELVFDATTGRRIPLPEIIAPTGLPIPAFVDLVDQVVTWLDGSGWKVEVRRARPTVDGLVLTFAPYEAGSYGEGTRQLFIPWRVLEDLGA